MCDPLQMASPDHVAACESLVLIDQSLAQEVKLGDPVRVRALFSRATHAEMPVKKMSSIFKRFLEYEQAHGNAQSVASVQAAAQAYVDEHMAR